MKAHHQLKWLKLCLEKIYIMVTERIPEKKAALLLNEQYHSEMIVADDKKGKELIEKFGTYKGYSKFQLALDYLQMSNDRFFEIYGFNFVPETILLKVTKEYIMNKTLGTINIGVSSELSSSVAKKLSREIGGLLRNGGTYA